MSPHTAKTASLQSSCPAMAMACEIDERGLQLGLVEAAQVSAFHCALLVARQRD
jgi:hypothetical protein